MINLQDLKFFKNFPADIVQNLQKCAEVVKYKRGDIIIEQGKQNHAIYFLLASAHRSWQGSPVWVVLLWDCCASRCVDQSLLVPGAMSWEDGTFWMQQSTLTMADSPWASLSLLSMNCQQCSKNALHFMYVWKWQSMVERGWQSNCSLKVLGSSDFFGTYVRSTGRLAFDHN